MFRNYDLSLKIPATLTVILAFGLWISCQPERPPTDPWSSAMVTNPFRPRVPVPKRISEFQALTRTAARFLDIRSRSSSATDVRDHFARDLIGEISRAGGMPRWQIKSLLEMVLVHDSRSCGGAHCARVFGITPNGIDEFLDDIVTKIKSDQRSKDPQFSAQKDLLLASFISDVQKIPEGKPDQVVPLKDKRLRQASSSLGPLSMIRYRDLNHVTALEVDASTGPRLDELAAFPNLKSLTVKAYTPNDLLKIVPALNSLDSLTIHAAPFDAKRSTLGISDLELLFFATKIKTVHIGGIDLSDASAIASNFAQIRHLTLEAPFGVFDDRVMTGLSQLPELRRLSLIDVDYHVLGRLKNTLPKSVTRFDFSHFEHPKNHRDSEDFFTCGNLSALTAFRHASTVTLNRCHLEGLGPFTQPVSWQILQINQSTSSSPLVLSLPPGMEQLKVLSVEQSPMIQVNTHTLQELSVRQGMDARR